MDRPCSWSTSTALSRCSASIPPIPRPGVSRWWTESLISFPPAQANTCGGCRAHTSLPGAPAGRRRPTSTSRWRWGYPQSSHSYRLMTAIARPALTGRWRRSMLGLPVAAAVDRRRPRPAMPGVGRGPLGADATGRHRAGARHNCGPRPAAARLGANGGLALAVESSWPTNAQFVPSVRPLIQAVAT